MSHPSAALPAADSDVWRCNVALQALRAYGFEPGSVSIQPLNHVNNLTYRVQLRAPQGAPQTFMLRIQRRSDVDARALSSELAWLVAMRTATDLLVPSPVPTRTGAWFDSMVIGDDARPRYHVLFSWLPARFIPTRDQDATAAAHVGAFIGRLHQHARGFQPGPAFHRRCLDVTQLVDWTAIDAASSPAGIFTAAHRSLFAQAQERTRQVFGILDARSTAFGLIHADLIWKNYFFHDHDVGAVDFDDCGWGYYLYDLAPTLVGYHDEPHYAALRRGLLAGYRQECSLPPAEERLLDTLMAARHVASCCWLAQRLDDPVLRARASDIVASRTQAIRGLLASG